MYSASGVDESTESFRPDFQEIAPPFIISAKPVCERFYITRPSLVNPAPEHTAVRMKSVTVMIDLVMILS